MKKKNVLIALSSLTMASAVTLTAYTVATAPVHAEESVRKTEWVTISNDRSRTRTTVYFESGDQKIDKHSYIDKFEYQNTYVEAGVRYYVFVEKGTKLDELTNDPNASSEELNTQGYKTTEKGNQWRESGGNRYFYSKGNPVKGWAMIDGKMYYFNSEGVMAKGLIANDSERYYLGENGVKQTGIVKVGTTTYYFDSAGSRKTDIIQIDDKKYYAKDGIIQH